MKQNKTVHDRILPRIGLAAIAAILLGAMVFLVIGSMLGTADMNQNNAMLELITFEDDSVGLNIAMLLLFLAIGIGFMVLVRRLGWLKKLTAGKLSWAIGLWVFVMGSLWVVQSMSSPTHDSLIVTRAGVAAAMGNYEYLENVYFVRFPFQLGYVFWTEIWARLFGLNEHSYLFMEFVNVACLAFGEMALVRLTERLFRNRNVTFATTVTLALFIQPMIFCSFLYGTTPGFCFAVWAMLLFVRYLQTDKWRFIVGSSLLLALSVSLKLNNMILLVAMVIILILHLLRRGNYLRHLASTLILCVLVLTLKNVGVWRYEARLDTDFGDGIPMISWMAMGLNEASTAPGWYNYTYTIGNFNAANGDGEVAAEASKAEIEKRLEFFKENPADAADFFSKKILSQWSEPTYQSLWNNQVRGQYMEKFGFAAYACGEGEYRIKDIMDLGVQFIFFGTLISTVYLFLSQLRKKGDRRPEEAALWLIPLTILGGFLYHALFEAKSQYVITYVTMMIPYAIWGLAQVTRQAFVWAPKVFQNVKVLCAKH